MEKIVKNKSLAVKNAEKIISEYKIQNAKELDLELIANAERLIVEEADLGDTWGKIVYNSDGGIIKINKNLRETGQKRFTLAHELGHYFNEKDFRTNSLYKHIDKFLGFNNKNKYEDDANEFAAELLMHRIWFNDFCKGKKINME